MTTNEWPVGAPDPHVYYYKVLPATTREDEATAWFAGKFGQPPDWVVDYAGWLWVGPVPASVIASAAKQSPTKGSDHAPIP